MTTDMNEATTWLTQEAYDRLQAELAQMSGPGRVAIAKKIEAAREEGDLKENGGYHAAKEEQGKQEARIRQLTHLLRDAQVGTVPMSEGVAGPGVVVTVRFAGESETERFLIGSREDSAHGDLEIYSAHSPLGRALTGHQTGESVSYSLPNGSTMNVAIVAVEPYTG